MAVAAIWSSSLRNRSFDAKRFIDYMNLIWVFYMLLDRPLVFSTKVVLATEVSRAV